jgi:hypothetical protein
MSPHDGETLMIVVAAVVGALIYLLWRWSQGRM